ncbi:pentatricopeptide repeat-containing protein At1g02370, mitochondrial-like [Salvia miltiorrhiza]|uniref:pentatricopeptide repeat-containing protein At1g02370, mitochondrial-like n=1 Tax=Salvia miltiorrhiza TaxID=226208 RepID=UPI0025ABEBDD|nr:pentatricopeptide repeat-containing protein At1g02370, mitochondrial-like [Salvia miltiorrhiza]
MAIMRIIGRLILQKSSQSSLPRLLSTAAQQPKSRNTLFYKVVGASSKSSIADVINEWVRCGKIVRKGDIVNISNYFRSRKNFRAALQLYEWIDSSNLQITAADHAIHIDLLGRAEGLASAEKYFDSLSEKTSKTYGALLSCYCRERALDKALETFEKINEFNHASTLDFNNVLSLYYNLAKPEKVVSLVQEMEEKNIAPDIYTFNMLINSHAALNNLDALEGVMEKMENSNIKPDLFTYGNLATIYFNAGLHDKATAFLELMEKMEAKKNTAREACRTRLRLYSMMNDLSGVNRAWEALKLDEPKPSNTSYLFMLLALAKLGNQENLEKILMEWEESQTLYDYRLPNVLLDYYISRDMIEEANSLYKRLADGLTDRGSDPNLKTLELFTSLCLKNSEIDLALEYLEKGLDKAKSRDSRWFPRDETVEEFIRYFEEKSDTERGGKFIESMKKHNRLSSNSLLLYIKATEAGS